MIPETLHRIFAGPLPLLETSVREEFSWGHLPEAWVVFLLVVPVVLAGVAFVYRRERLADRPAARVVLIALRCSVILAILAFLAQPVLRRITYQMRDPQLLVVVDDSLSMGIADKFSTPEIPQRIGELLGKSPELVESLTRYGLIDRVLTQVLPGREQPVLETLRETMDVSIYTFAGAARKVADLPRRGKPGAEAQAIASLPDHTTVQGDPRVKETRLGDGVLESFLDTEAQSSGGDHGVIGVLLLTDGQSNAGILQPEVMAEKLRQRGIPLLVVGVGNPDPPKNIRVVNVDVQDVVLVGDQVTFDAGVVADGFEGQSVEVRLLLDGDVVETEFATLEGRGQRQTVRLEHRPKRPGDFSVTVEVEKLGGEIFHDDNNFSRPIKVLDQKIKVLYVEGPPRWEYRFLKNALIRDPTMEAQVLLLSADGSFRQESSPDVPPLAGFPASQADLFAYHVVIIGDVDPLARDALGRPFQELFELLQKFVAESGGGVVFITGFQANPHRYSRTALAPLLPVEIPDVGAGFGAARDIAGDSLVFNVELTGAGREHPVMRLESDAARNADLWESRDGIAENHLPGFLGYAPAKKAKLGGIPLAVHPRVLGSDGPMPIFAIQNYSKGRVFYSGVDNTWRWRAGVDNLYFYRFWGQVIRYAASGRLLGQTPRFAIATDKRLYTIGEKVRIDAKVFDANMEPSKEPVVTVYHGVRGRDLDPPRKLELELNPAREAGAYEGSLTAGQLGSHDLWLGAEGERLAFTTFSVEVPPLEFRNPRMDRDKLQRVARLSEGKYYDLHEFMTAMEFLSGNASPRQIPIGESQDDLWDEYWVLLVFTGVIASEWILRKLVKLL